MRSKSRHFRAPAMLSIAAALGFGLAACSSGNESQPSSQQEPTSNTAEPTTTTAIEWPEPTFAAGTCPMPIPAGVTVDCGTVTVPENRTKSDSAMITLAVARIHSRSATPKTDPVVNLEGGPGFDSLANVEAKSKSMVLDDRDYIIWDQRGLGFSKPNLDCAEVNEAIWTAFSKPEPTETESSAIEAGLLACRDRAIAAGVDLSGYNTTENAADLADIRIAMGIDEWNLRGVSYGSALAIETVRRHPEGLRSVLLDSVVAPDAAFGGLERGEAAARAFDELYAACAADPACAERYGDVEELAHKAAATLDAKPYESAITDPDTDAKRPIAITGDDLWAGLFNAMYDNELIGLMPSFLQAVADGKPQLIDAVAADGIPFAMGQAEMMTASVSCIDRQRLLRDDEFGPFLTKRPELEALVDLMAPEMVCPTLDLPSADPAFNTLLSETDVPIVVMAGRFDPVTPPEGSRRTAEALGQELLLFPSVGHGAVGSSDCAFMIWESVMNDPGAAPDTSCIANEAPITFA